MAAQIIDGKTIAADIRREVREQSDRMAGAAQGQLTALQEQGERMAGAARLRLEAMRDQVDRPSGAAGTQLAGLWEQHERMAAAARQPISPFRVRSDLPSGSAGAGGPRPVNTEAEERHAANQAKLREAAEFHSITGIEQCLDDLTQLGEDGRHLARQLQELSQNVEFEKIMTILNQLRP